MVIFLRWLLAVLLFAAAILFTSARWLMPHDYMVKLRERYTQNLRAGRRQDDDGKR